MNVLGNANLLRVSLEKVILFKAAFSSVFHRKLVNQRYVSAKRNIDLQQLKLTLRAVCLFFKYVYFFICF